MIICPWCGTHYAAFQSNCKNCGGPLSMPPTPQNAEEHLPEAPPAPPRPIADSYAGRLMLADGWSITAGVFALVGAIFTLVGGMLTLGIITALVGLPFMGLGLLFFGGGAAIMRWRYTEMQKRVGVLRRGQAARGQIVSVEENYAVRINHRHPWVITYQFQVGGRDYAGKVTTLNSPGPGLQPGKAAYVLYLPETPEQNALYPHP
jgi:hypothetical protein